MNIKKHSHIIRYGMAAAIPLLIAACDAGMPIAGHETPIEIRQYAKEINDDVSKKIEGSKTQKAEILYQFFRKYNYYTEHAYNYHTKRVVIEERGHVYSVWPFRITYFQDLFTTQINFLDLDMGDGKCTPTLSEVHAVNEENPSIESQQNAYRMLGKYIPCFIGALPEKALRPAVMDTYYYPFLDSRYYEGVKDDPEFIKNWRAINKDGVITVREWVNMMFIVESLYF